MQKSAWLWKLHWVKWSSQVNWWIASGIVRPWQAKLPDGRLQLAPDCSCWHNTAAAAVTGSDSLSLQTHSAMTGAACLAQSCQNNSWLPSAGRRPGPTSGGSQQADGDPREEGPGTFLLYPSPHRIVVNPWPLIGCGICVRPIGASETGEAILRHV